jgi:hypothetical protein
MQLVSENRTLVTTGQMTAKAFGFNFGPQMAELLSGLYSDIPWALMREYGTNMRDGYVKLPPGHPVIPPEIHLPTELSPNLVFKDYGVGMSFETVWDVFPTYNASTKRDNNDEAGGLGIGAKAAFCYRGADQWTVESRYNGERMQFIAAKDSDGMPTFFHVLTEPTSEPNGVTVTIPIARADFDVFRDAARRFVEYFPMPLKIVGDPEVAAYKPPEPLFAGATWRVHRTRGTTGETREWRAVMGNIPYPVNARALYNRDFGTVPLELADRLALDLVLPIGSLDLVPSREALKYTDRTYAALLAAVRTFRDEVRPHVEAQLAECKTRWEALTAAHRLDASYQLKALVGKPTWNGEQIDLSKGIEVYTGLAYTGPVAPKGAPPALMTDTWPDLAAGWMGVQAGDKGNVRFGKDVSVIRVSPNPSADPCEVFVDDMDKKEGERRLRQYLTDKHINVYGRRSRRVRVYGGAYLVKASGLTPELLSETLGGAPVRLTSELPAVTRAAPGTRTRTQVKRLRGSYRWEDTEVTVEDGGWFVRLSRDDAVDFYGRNASGVSSLLALLRTVNVMKVPDVVYGIPRTLSSMEKKPGWQDFIAKARKAVAKLPARYAERYALRAAFSSYNTGKTGLLLRALNPEALPEGSAVRTLVECVRRVDADDKRMEAVIELVNSFYELKWPDAEVPDPAALVAEIRAKDPLFSLVLDMMESHVEPNRIAEVLTPYLNGAPAVDNSPALAAAA